MNGRSDTEGGAQNMNGRSDTEGGAQNMNGRSDTEGPLRIFSEQPIGPTVNQNLGHDFATTGRYLTGEIAAKQAAPTI